MKLNKSTQDILGELFTSAGIGVITYHGISNILDKETSLAISIIVSALFLKIGVIGISIINKLDK